MVSTMQTTWTTAQSASHVDAASEHLTKCTFFSHGLETGGRKAGEFWLSAESLLVVSLLLHILC